MDSFKKNLINFIKNIKYHKISRCNICGKLTIFVCFDITKARGDFICIYCGSFSRKRHVAKIINKIMNTSSISDIPKKSNIKIYNTDIDDSFYKVLLNYEGFFCSDLIPDIKLGKEIKKGSFCQNIEKLTFTDDSFDLIITEDVLEHVKNYKIGFKEIYRTLKRGGYHIFTIPFNFDKKSINYISEDENRIIVEEYHDSKRGKVLAYRTFGIDLYQFLDSIGFETYVDFSVYRDHKYGIFDSFVFVSKKM